MEVAPKSQMDRSLEIKTVAFKAKLVAAMAEMERVLDAHKVASKAEMEVALKSQMDRALAAQKVAPTTKMGRVLKSQKVSLLPRKVWDSRRTHSDICIMNEQQTIKKVPEIAVHSVATINCPLTGSAFSSRCPSRKI
jgi:hypothetical protein